MKYNPSLKHNLRKINEDYIPDDKVISWLKDYLKDVKRGEGWVDIDKVVYDADIELGVDLSKNKKELAAYIKKIGGGSLLKESAIHKVKGKKITEATARGETDIELSNTSGVLKLNNTYSGVALELWAGGNGFRDSWKNPEYAKKLEEYWTTRDKSLEAELRKEYVSLHDDILKVANMFDKEVERVMNKHGFRK